MKGVGAGIGKRRLDKVEKDGAADFTSNVFNPLVGGSPFVPAAMGNAMPKVDSAGNIPATPSTFASDDIKGGIASTASSLGIDPVDLATAISYETAGTFDPRKKGPVTQWGQHEGLIQFGEPQAKKYGVDWENPVGSQLGPDGAVAKYLKDAGVQPGMGMMDIYSAINAGRVGRYGASDANNGGAPGTVADKVNQQMAGHRAKALAMFADAQPQEVASLDPSARMTPMPVDRGAMLAEPASISPEDAARLAAMRGDTSGAVPYSGPGAQIDNPMAVYDTQGLRMPGNGSQPQTAAAAIEAISPTQQPGSLSDEVAAFQATPDYAAQFPGRESTPTQARADSPFVPAEFRGSQQLMGATGGIMPALMGGRPATDEQMAQARQAAQQQPSQQSSVQQKPQGANALGLDPRLIAALSNPFVAPEQKAILQAMAEQQMQEAAAVRERSIKASDPSTQLEMDYKRAQIEALKAKGDKQSLINAGDGRLYDPNSGAWISAPDAAPKDGKFRFDGKSVEAQALNGLMDSNTITPEQAQQLGAGKTITGPNGEIMFLTPDGVFSRQGNGGQPQAGPTQGNTVPQTQAQPNLGKQSAMIPLTEPKVTIDEKKAMTFADRMKESGLVIDEHGAAGQGIVDTLASKIPFAGNYMVSDEFQNLDQARRNFINAQLRRESGAVISNEEFDNANKQYFPQPGDNKETIEMKRRNRQTVTDGMARDGGPTYGGDNTVDPLGIR
ncbi:hypothetical protein [Pararhizobium sp. DWP1-1-3]|uniref:hypothetical protein n=1 Tax=Pararhizobium sp. DWP1-1-3 TaxID=2804652 RepID=UPI003CF80BCC